MFCGEAMNFYSLSGVYSECSDPQTGNENLVEGAISNREWALSTAMQHRFVGL